MSALLNRLSLSSTALASLCRQHRVRRLIAFGSVLTPAFGAESDVDLVAEFDPMPIEHYAGNYLSLKEALEGLVHRTVDLLEIQALRNPYLRAEIERTQQLLYAAA
ncbi:nucleotidyltransferase family protein [uncultured Hymenobacter sp.]|uniref:nucleotidyltransferase family protein n=1 Tax=uncultured Hymenobacter sp. TaxID=170016 RepID=UPI0035CC63FB